MPPSRMPLLVLASWTICAVNPALALKPGDPAPALHVAEWVNGESIAIADGRDRNVFVIEFWSAASRVGSGALPQLSTIQDDFADRNVICIAVATDAPTEVREFIDRMKEPPSCRVAVDEDGKSFRAYMEAADVGGLPHAFIVEKSGRLAWHGHPLDDMEDVLRTVLGGEDGAAEARRLPDVGRMSEEQLLERLSLAFAGENWERVLVYLDELIKRNPEDQRYVAAKLRMLAAGKNDVPAATAYGRTLIEAHREDAEFLNEMAWRLLTTEDYRARCPELAYEAAVAADRASDSKRADVTDTLARALYQIGRLDEAIRFQEKAVRLGKENDSPEEVRTEMEHTLQYYRGCAAARDRARSTDG